MVFESFEQVKTLWGEANLSVTGNIVNVNDYVAICYSLAKASAADRKSGCCIPVVQNNMNILFQLVWMYEWII